MGERWGDDKVLWPLLKVGYTTHYPLSQHILPDPVSGASMMSRSAAVDNTLLQSTDELTFAALRRRFPRRLQLGSS